MNGLMNSTIPVYIGKKILLRHHVLVLVLHCRGFDLFHYVLLRPDYDLGVGCVLLMHGESATYPCDIRSA